MSIASNSSLIDCCGTSGIELAKQLEESAKDHSLKLSPFDGKTRSFTILGSKQFSLERIQKIFDGQGNHGWQAKIQGSDHLGNYKIILYKGFGSPSPKVLQIQWPPVDPEEVKSLELREKVAEDILDRYIKDSAIFL